jgi:aminocarboxymuconate-semialdehyde decarboxylase
MARAAKKKKPTAKRTASKKRSAPKRTAARRSAARRGTATRTPRGPKAKPFALDWHTHIFVPEVVAFNRDHMVVNGFRPAPQAQEGRNFTRGDMTWDLDPAKRTETMDNMRVDMQLLSASLVHQCTYWADPQDSLKYDRMSNDRIADLCHKFPSRFVGIATVPLQAPQLAAQELERAVKELGLRGANISSHVNGTELGMAGLDPFWAKAVELDVPVYIHPHGNGDPRYQRYLFWNSIGQNLEETMAMLSLVHDGVMDAYPNLKIVFAHGGGFIPYAPGRVDRNSEAERRDRLASKIQARVSDYLDRFYFDTCLYDPVMLYTLSQRVGPDRLIMGSDYPVGDLDPVGFVERERTLGESERRGILGQTASRLLKIGA